MPTLHVRSVPEDLYQRLKTLAQKQNRSLSAQVVSLLYSGVKEEERRQRSADALAAIRRRRFTPSGLMKDSTNMLRDDQWR